MITGGVAKYVELFVDWGCLTRNIDIAILKAKANAFMNATHSFVGYEMEYRGLSLSQLRIDN